MNIKDECNVYYEDGVESGQCSDDEVQIIKKEKKSRKHKKKDKTRKSRKRRHSSGSSGSSSEFFNPYSVKPGKFNIKAECVEMIEEVDNNKSDTTNSLIAVETNSAMLEPTATSGVQDDNNNNIVTEVPIPETMKRRESEYRIDITGIDSVKGDLYHYLLDLGITLQLVEDLMQVYHKSEEEVVKDVDTPTHENEEEDDDGYEEQMINDIPIIEQATLYSSCYSPEPANDLYEPYKPQAKSTVSYASNAATLARPTNHLIDPSCIPDVNPRDPRLIHTKTLLQMKPTAVAAKPTEVSPERPSPRLDLSPVMSREWESTVVNVVKTHLRLYLEHNDIDREEYRSILRRAVTKIISSGEKKLETDKISRFLHSYVLMVQKSRDANNM